MTSHDRSNTSACRRDFLKRASLATAGVAAACLPGALRAAPESNAWKMRLSGSTVNFSRESLEEACRRIAAVGFEAIDVWGEFGHCRHLDYALEKLGPAGLKELLAKHRLTFYAASVYSRGYSRYAKLIGEAGGSVAVRGSDGPCDKKDLVPRMKAFLEALKREADLAGTHHAYLAIENHGHALLDSLDSFKAFVDLNKHPRLGIALAPYHVELLGESVPDVIRAAGSQLFFFYAWQNDGKGATSVEQLPGVGSTDCTPWLAALAEVNYRWYVNPFLHAEPPADVTQPALVKSCEYLRKCYGKSKAGRK
jgi:sugar phosphate isomerase/epimerase